MSLGKRINEGRQSLEMTQQEMASSLDVSPQYISAIEKDSKIPSLMQTARIAQMLRVSIDYLVFGEERETKDLVVAITSDTRMNQKTKKALIALAQEIYGMIEDAQQ
jgi:transcriptional regulator with XRE-family HTH domain